MGLLMFPFVVCLLSSPFVVGGVLLYMWHQDRKAKELRGWRNDYKHANVCAMKEALEWQKRNGGKSLAFGEGKREYDKIKKRVGEKYGVDLL